MPELCLADQVGYKPQVTGHPETTQGPLGCELRPATRRQVLGNELLFANPFWSSDVQKTLEQIGLEK